MPQMPDLTDPRYLDEVGWFLYHEKYERDRFGGSYDAERLAYSRLLLNEVVGYLGRMPSWLESKTVVSVGCGCTGDLAAFPATVKIAIDPEQEIDVVKREANEREDRVLIDREFRVADAVRMSVNGRSNREREVDRQPNRDRRSQGPT